jgi:CRP/FNR family nitrogen fixation transcriptional regulator
MDREQIADYLGIGLETVSRAITDLERQGLIARGKNRREILIDNVCSLCRLAHSGRAL